VVFDSLHESVLSGEYSAGEWLRQEEISRRLGVSMTPVREALDLLVSAGVAERVAYRGVRVVRPSEPDILDSYELRLLLEGAAAMSAAKSSTPAQISGLKQILEEEAGLLGLGQIPRQRSVSRALHTGIVEASNNPLLLQIYNEVLKSFPDWMLYEQLYRHPEQLENSFRHEHHEHELIVSAIGDRNGPVAAFAAVDHILRRGRELETHLGISREALAAREESVTHMLPTTMQAVGGTKQFREEQR
jgi:DNA-binding GntR family transcriptional regulator